MKTLELKNDKLGKILEDRTVLYNEIGKINEELVELDKERTKLGYKMNKLKEKTSVIMDKLMPSLNLGEFEVVSKVYLNKYNKPEIEIVDKVEEYIALLREEAKKLKK